MLVLLRCASPACNSTDGARDQEGRYPGIKGGCSLEARCSVVLDIGFEGCVVCISPKVGHVTAQRPGTERLLCRKLHAAGDPHPLRQAGHPLPQPSFLTQLQARPPLSLATCTL